MWVVQRRERAKAGRRGTGRGEEQCVLCSERQCVVWRASVCCVWTSDTVIEGRRKGIVHLGRDTEFEWRQSRTKKEVTE